MLGPHVAISSSPLRAPTIVVFSTVTTKLSLPSVGSFESDSPKRVWTEWVSRTM